ncbi:hypothetical protein SAMN05414139_03918 [Burkholderia sp. D7]|nr:hypothetical protein SAMN05414139_03918 [Burkholderia sp. D7]
MTTSADGRPPEWSSRFPRENFARTWRFEVSARNASGHVFFTTAAAFNCADL